MIRYTTWPIILNSSISSYYKINLPCLLLKRDSEDTFRGANVHIRTLVPLTLPTYLSTKKPSFLLTHSASVWPDWAIYCMLGNILKPVAKIILPKSPTFLGNFGKGGKIFHFSTIIINWATFIDIGRLNTCHTARLPI